MADKARKNQMAILLLDFQNKFAKKGGKLHHDVAVTMEKTCMLQNVPKLVDLARYVWGGRKERGEATSLLA
eukprot:12128183-Ditylum_brightwellii.AAC.1